MKQIPVHNEPHGMAVGTKKDEPKQGKSEAESKKEAEAKKVEVTVDMIDEEKQTEKGKNSWSEEIEIAGGQLVNRIKEIIAEGNVRRLILRTHDDKLIMEIPLTAGAVVGGLVIFVAPLMTALGAIAALVARIKVQIVRVDDKDDKDNKSE